MYVLIVCMMKKHKFHEVIQLSMRQQFNNKICLLIRRGAFRSVSAICANRNRINEIGSARILQQCGAFAQVSVNYEGWNFNFGNAAVN